MDAAFMLFQQHERGIHVVTGRAEAGGTACRIASQRTTGPILT